MLALKHFVLIVAMSGAALTVSAQEFVPAVKVPNGQTMLDSKTFRVMALNQRLWSLQDQKRKQEADLMNAALDVHSYVARSSSPEKHAKWIGISDSKLVREKVIEANIAILRIMHDAAARILASHYVEALSRALIARTQIDAVDVQIKELKSDLAAVEGKN